MPAVPTDRIVGCASGGVIAAGRWRNQYLAAFTLKSAATSGNAPFSIGHSFKKGDVPSGSSLIGSIADCQVVAKSTWPDGSLRFATVSGRANLVANVATTVTLSIGSPSGMALTIDDLKATGITASITAAVFGSASWATTDWDTPWQTWVSGPKMSSWVYRKSLGSDSHLVGFLEVRLWSGGEVEVLPWVENGYLTVAGPTGKSDTYSFALGGTTRFSQAINFAHHTRSPLVSGSVLSYWLGADPLVMASHDVAYLQATEQVPSYRASVAAGHARVTAQVSTYTPLQQGNFDYYADDMASSGYQRPIGLLPEHDVLYLVADPTDRYGIYASVIRNGYSAGRYALHYRDEATNRPLRFSAHPNLVIFGQTAPNDGFKDEGGSTTGTYTPAVTGIAASGPVWDVAHAPSVGYMAYLLTGRWYFMEQVQFAATCEYLGKGDNSSLRDGAKNLVKTAIDAWQTRACAWQWRTLVNALAVTPDADTVLRSEFIASVESNISDLHTTYVAQDNNPFGWIAPGETYGGETGNGAPWQQDFVTAAFGYSLSLDLPIGSTAKNKLQAFFAWKAKSVVMRLGPNGAWWYINCDPYNHRVSPNAVPDYLGGTGPWYADSAAAYAATFATPPAWFGSTEGTIAFEYQPDYNSAVSSMFGNLQPAIAYAVRHGVTGAQSAYNRMVGATNWANFETAFNTYPMWSAKPATIPAEVTSFPAWRQSAPLNTWIEIPNTAYGNGALDAWGAFTLKPSTGELITAAPGGHADSSYNGADSIALLSDTPTWVNRYAGSAPTVNVLYYADGTPTSRHLYTHIHYIESLDAVLLAGCRYGYGGGTPTGGGMDLFSLETNQYLPRYTYPDIPDSGYGIVKDGSGRIWTTSGRRFDPADESWSAPIAGLGRFPAAYDSLRDELFSLQWGDGQGFESGTIARRVNPATGATDIITFNTSAAYSAWQAAVPAYAALDYDADNGNYLFYHGGETGKVYVITPNSGNVWDMSVLDTTGMPAPAPGAGINKRFIHVPALKGFVLVPSASSNIWFLRTA